MTQQDSGRAFQRGCGVYALGLLFLCGFIALLGKIQAEHVWDGGVRVEGVVVAIQSDVVNTSVYTAKRSTATKTIQYEYLVDGQVFRDHQTVAYNTIFFKGQKVPVIYLPNTPWDAQILIDKPQILEVGIGLFILLVIGVLIVISRQNYQKQKRKPHEESRSI